MKKPIWKNTRAVLFSAALLTLAFVPTVRPVAAKEPPAATTLTQKQREEVFEIVWSRINERFFDPKFHGVDWGLMRRRYQPQAVQATSDAAFYEVLERMLGELKQSHIGIIPPEAYQDLEETGKGGDDSKLGTAGVVVQWVEEKPVITQVTPKSAGDVAGLRPGFVLTAIGDKEMSGILDRLRKRAKEPRDFKTIIRLGVTRLLDGPLGSEVVIKYLDGEDKPQTTTLKRTPLEGKLVRFGELPPMTVSVESRRLPGNIGYIRANIFLMPILEPIREAIRKMADAPGIIFDLRGNPGGIGVLANGIAGSFYSQPTNLGSMTMRQGNINFLTNPQPKIYKGPLVILTDEGSVSTSEIMAGGMQENGRAVVIGEATAGQVLPSVVEVLPGGARFQYAFADYKTPKGVLLEGRGVQPTIPVNLTRQELLTGEDPVIKAAIAYINKRQGANVKK